MLLIIAIVGTTVAPWQLFFQQSYVINKRITLQFIAYEKADLWILLVMGSAHQSAHCPYGIYADRDDPGTEPGPRPAEQGCPPVRSTLLLANRGPALRACLAAEVVARWTLSTRVPARGKTGCGHLPRYSGRGSSVE